MLFKPQGGNVRGALFTVVIIIFEFNTIANISHYNALQCIVIVTLVIIYGFNTADVTVSRSD